MRRSRTFVVAEIGVNHNGSLALAKKLVDAAVAAGADAVKFQSFHAESLVSSTAPKADYQKDSLEDTEPQYEMLRKLQLSIADHGVLRRYCEERHIEFMSTPFDMESVRMLVRDLNVTRIKIASGEVTNFPLLVEIARAKKPVILSTGMCTLGEVESALAALAFGFIHTTSSEPTLTEFYHAYCSTDGQIALSQKVCLLHTTSEYPAPMEQVNLRAMNTLEQAFRLPVGLSDHTQGFSVAIAAVARGAAMIEKHITLDCSMEGPDHSASMEPDGFKQMVKCIREVEIALGSALKHPMPSERGNAQVSRKSIVAAMPIAQGDIFNAENLTAKRPGTGISPMYYWELLGKVAPRPYKKDEMIEWTLPFLGQGDSPKK
ncbi:N-acetylneuraminate synthase [Alicyclobacillus fastidiosus]|uniref:N-acetylneuraminate synthase n=1 Tax=Alicyclobacillus fastidiosus TaxID=392011 RepID=A0ABY6ZB62_9BACL|nr:N-acetylneuraminate synthase [Alicyclobacillus fastidiosus]WAH39772.1 N-acetylneuraminate synthase [Alicyclobacillus fastidiosus]GMA61014.1 sialic acid synthase [Alicyclobacillus fastidiosus]